MTEIVLRKATEADLTELNSALQQLSEHMGDPHAITDTELGKLLFNDPVQANALVAEKRGEIVGTVMYSPFISTTKGGAGIYISDLWVSAAERGQGLGPKLMSAAADHAGFDVKLIRLAVYHTNPDAFQTYLKLGFKPDETAEFLSLASSDFKNIRGKK
ncbi:GNAT family N-acetyltransferase [Sneathiella aquimaris]|uniref:GNAT family N-acetyltransferase n=1 Tax=Sneathiella aquimaris TaxID=2599305 RepID=UPI00146E0C95|nr:GNAT family N-acetyltransferase [Sneathiella aquimaris]